MATPRIGRPRDFDPSDTGLPPPGDERREVLRERTDELAEAAETEGPERYAVPEGTFSEDAVENEIAQHFNEMEVPHGDHATYRYKWVYRDPEHKYANRMVQQARVEGWELVRASSPEAKGMEDMHSAENTLWVGDTVLMRCRWDIVARNEKREETNRRLRERGPELEAQELGERLGRRWGAKIRPASIAEMRGAALARHVQDTAMRRFDQQIRQGTVPGRPAGR